MIFRRVPAATELFLCVEASQSIFQPGTALCKQMQTSQLACKIARTKAPSATVLRDQLCFSFSFASPESIESHGAMRRSVVCLLHTAYAQPDSRCIAPPRTAQAPEKEHLPCIVGPPGMRVPRTPALQIVQDVWPLCLCGNDYWSATA